MPRMQRIGSRLMVCALAATFAVAPVHAEDLLIETDTDLDTPWEGRVIVNPSEALGVTVGLLPGAEICCGTYVVGVHKRSILNVDGGLVYGDVWMYNRSTLNHSSGTIADSLWAYDRSTVNLLGGLVARDIYARYAGVVDLSAGVVGGELRAHERSISTIRGGTLHGVASFHTASVVIEGGTVLGFGLKASDESTIEIRGGGFLVDGDSVDFGALEASSGRLTGVLSTGAYFDNFFYQAGHDDSKTGTISLVEAEATIIELSDGELHSVADDTYADVSLRLTGTTGLALLEGGSVVNVYGEDVSSTDLSGGSISASLLAGGTSTFDVTSGAVGGSIYSDDQASGQIRGGNLGGSLVARGESQMQIFGYGFEVDGLPVPVGAMPMPRGFLTGTLESGEGIGNEFFQGGHDADTTGIIELVLDEAASSLQVFDDGGQHVIDTAVAGVATSGSTSLGIVGGGSVTRVDAGGSSAVTLSGGSVSESAVAFGDATFALESGGIGADLLAYDTSHVAISGGSIAGSIFAREGSTVDVSGHGFDVRIPRDGGYIEMPAPPGPMIWPRGTLFAELASGELLQSGFRHAGDDAITTGTISLVLDEGVVRYDDGASSHQVADTALSDAVVSVAGTGTVLDLAPGGELARVYVGATGELLLTGGEIGEDLIVSGGGRATIEAGDVGDDLVATDGAVVTILGGGVDNRLYVEGDSLVTIRGSNLRFSETGSAGDLIPVEYGELAEQGGLLAGNFASGQPFTMKFFRGRFDPEKLGTLMLPEPGSMALQVVGLFALGALARRTRRG